MLPLTQMISIFPCTYWRTEAPTLSAHRLETTGGYIETIADEPVANQSLVEGKKQTLQRVRRVDTSAGRPTPIRRQLLTELSHTSSRGADGRVMTRDGQEIIFKPSMKHISPFCSAVYMLLKPYDIVVLFYSDINFDAQFALSLTKTQTFRACPYSFSPILVGCVLLTLGVGGVAGSIIGSKLPDLLLRFVARKIGQEAPPDERLKTVVIPMLFFVSVFVY